ncbi:cytochrome c nitrite reductase small subunit [Echinicola vietnamensis]|uniref:Cytochrome c nitrate reductase, small subunit n=1 Tax=Echinicola vietnamensis (strain DSM 17526 / LMG 23754 / KMM 6221) TaxID=926556 RepID=L0FWM0_ECHVK|nr:cytochrome c nitrite reductase small subunit [Echinicola vietnamensis]AGA77151.1 cytochrome c nitrate reductase, small subunit [Echinicola vietnamensis DSM 17526]
MGFWQTTKRRLFQWNLVPPHRWRKPAIVLVAAIVGLGIYVLKLSNAASYLSDAPQACVNCHLMTPQYITWTHSSHREVAHCNDCHVPHDNVFNKYFFKAKDGLYHASIFTLRKEPEVIRALAPSQAVIQSNCIRCHQDQVTDAKMMVFVEHHKEKRTDRTCWECHRDVPHGKVKSLSSVGYQIEPIKEYAPKDQEVIPAWLRSSMQKQTNQHESND